MNLYQGSVRSKVRELTPSQTSSSIAAGFTAVPVAGLAAASRLERHVSEDSHERENAETVHLLEGPVARVEIERPTYLQYVRRLHRQWPDCPNVCIIFQNLSYQVKRQAVDPKDLPAPFFLPLVRMFEDFLTAVPLTRSWFRPIIQTESFDVLKDNSGIIHPRSMTLVLAAPGHGKSQFLKALALRLETDPGKTGHVLYNGLTLEEAHRRGVYSERLCALSEQDDVHFAFLTVQETLSFASDSVVPDARLLHNVDEDLAQMHSQRTELLLEMMGLTPCAATYIGSDLVRGVSGGQRRRVTIGEMLNSNARIQLLDEPTTGLDSAVSFHLFEFLRQWCDLSGGSVVTALQQPTPEVFALFDTLILLREGQIVYQGPRTQVHRFFSQQLGISIPPEAEPAGFIVDFLSNPLRVLERIHQPSRVLPGPAPTFFQSSGLASASTQSPHVCTAHLESASNRVSSKREASFEDLFVPDGLPRQRLRAESSSQPTIEPAITTSEILQRYRSSEFFADVLQQINAAQQEVRPGGQYDIDPSRWQQFTRHQFGSKYSYSYTHYIRMDMIRQARLMIRNWYILVTRMVQAVVLGVIFATLFISRDPNQFHVTIGMLVYAVMFCGFANLSELAVANEQKSILTKQLDSYFYPVTPFILSNFIWSLPKLLVECLIFGTLLYWIPGLADNAGRFFFFLFVLFLTSLSLNGFFRFIAFVASNPDVALQLDLPFIIIFVLFSGYLVPFDKIHDWLVWLYWADPLAWSIRSLAQNEFFDSRYDDPVQAGSDRRGDIYLRLYGIQTWSGYKWWGVAFQLLFIAVFTCLIGLVIHYKLARAAPLLGTRRADPHQQPERVAVQQFSWAGHFTKSELIGYAVDYLLPLPAIALSPALWKQPHPHQQDASVEGVPVQDLPFLPATLSWRNIQYTVIIDKNNQKVPLKLLKGITAVAPSGKLTALMGESGAGKTTLLDVIAGRKTVGAIEGEVLINGRPIDPGLFNHFTAYVEQRNLHMGLTTVREALLFSAKLRLPTSIDKAQRERFVDTVMRLLCLDSIANRLVGDEATPGLSLGQLKLLTMGVEMAGNPSVLFLDEPTSGLDAPEAHHVMEVLQRVANTGRAVVCTIHQPSRDVFFKFDYLLLLRAGGELVYFGELGQQAQTLVNFLSRSCGDRAPLLQPGQNPANWMLDVVNAVASTKSSAAVDFAAARAQDESCRKVTQLTDITSQPTAEGDRQLELARRQIYPNGFSRYWELQKRYFKMHWRNSPANLTRILLLVMLAVILGLAYVGLSVDDFQGLQARISAIFVALSFPATIVAVSASPTFFRQRAAFYRETSVGMYNPYANNMAILIVELPYIFFSLAIFMNIYYWMAGLRANANLFFQFFLIVLLMSIIYASLSHLFLALSPNQAVSEVLMGFSLSMFFNFGGLFIPFSAFPDGWVWFYYVDPIPKALIATAAPQFFCDPTMSLSCPTISLPGSETSQFTYDAVAEQINGHAHQYGLEVVYLIVTFAIIRALNIICLRYVSWLKR